MIRMHKALDWKERGHDALLLATLFVIAWAVGGFLLRDDVFLYGDNPGHYWIMWYTINVAAPLQHQLIGWIPSWYAGYPELQFSPPGFALLGWLLNFITLGKFSTAWIYSAVAFASYVLPGWTFYYAVRHLGFERRVAFAAGLFGLVFPTFFDGAIAVFTGMIGSRIAFAVNALVVAWGIDSVEGRGTPYGLITAMALAIVILAHPYHAIGIMLALGLYALIRRRPLFGTAASLLFIILAAAALDAFWLMPLFAHSSTAMVPLVRATLDQTWRLITDASLLPYALLAIPAVVRVRREADSSRRALLVSLIALFFIIGAAMLGTHLVLIERLQVYQVDPVRLIGEYYFALIWLAALGVSEICTWISRLVWFERFHGSLSAGAGLLAVGAFLLIPLLQSVDYFHPNADDEPRFLSQAIGDYHLDEFWETLRATSGRVLFTSSYTNLSARGTQPFPTTLTALTPLLSNRPMMGGTYGHWSPIAALLWVGKINPPVLWGQSQDQDDRELFGSPLEDLSDKEFVAYCERFNITTIVASINDYRTRTFLDASPRVQSYYNNGFFFVYRVKGYASAWIDADNAAVDLVALTTKEIILRVHQAQSNASVNVKVYAYPLWRASTDNGQALPIARDDLGLMRIALPRGEGYTVALRYEEGEPERLGSLISFLSTALVLGGGGIVMVRQFRHSQPV